MIKLGDLNIKSIMLGDTPVKKVYRGTTLIWEKVDPYLSGISIPTLGYSLRKINPAYSGNVVLAQRQSDDAEQLIGFSGDSIDTAALLNFAGSASIGVKTLFEGNGAGVNATQTDKTKQPIIVDAGSLVTDNGLPSMDFGTLTTPKHLLITTDILGGKLADLYWAMTCRNYDRYGYVPFATTNGSSYWQIGDGGGSYIQNKGSINGSLKLTNNGSLHYFNLYATTLEVHAEVNNTSQNYDLTPTAIGTGLKTYSIGKFLGGSDWDLDGKISEFLIYDTNQAAKADIKTNIINYYGI